jgi:hypothetical protein
MLILIVRWAYYLFFTLSIINAQTILPTSINEDIYFYKTNSPYLVNNTVTINEGSTVQFEKGCTILFDNAQTFHVLGILILSGTSNDSIYLSSSTQNTYWGPIVSDNGTLVFSYNVISSVKKIISSNHGIIKINNSKIKTIAGSDGDDGISVHYVDTLKILNSELEGAPTGGKIDCIDADGVSYSLISGNIIKNWPDDGIDIGTGSQNIYIINNTISNNDCGISIGENSNVYVENNVIYDNAIGIQSHNGSISICNQNTLVGNHYSLQPYHGSDADTGGTINIINSIMSSALYLDYNDQINSVVDIAYCLSDTDILIGVGNIYSDPLFCSAEQFDYTLSQNSPCVGTGENGANMGAFGVGCEVLSNSENTSITPTSFVLHQSHPNPFNPTTQIKYDLPEDALVSINIYDLMGRSIKSLVNSNQSAGYRSIQWNATNNLGEPVSAGMYIYMIQAGEFRQTKKMVLLK